MKRLLIILIFICAAGKLAEAAPDSTLVPVVVAGHVISSFNGLGIPAHPVYILGDTFSTINIYDSAFTNALGYYADTFLVPASALYSFKVYTNDCQGIEHDSMVSGPNNYFQADFVICDTLPPLFNLGGQVFGGLFPLEEGYVVLYKPSSPEYLALDTALLNLNGVYYFYQLPAGTYIAKAFAPGNPAGQQRYFPTYQQSSLIWQSSAPIALLGDVFSADISLYPVPAKNPGNAAVSGDVFLNTATTPLPLVNTEIILFDSLMDPIDYVLSGPDGTYAFSQLPEGYYYLRPEVPGKTIPEVAFQLGNGAPLNADVDLAVPGEVIGIQENDEAMSASQVFPNPASSVCNIRLEPRSPAQILLQVIDISGRILSKQEFRLTAGTSTLEIPIQSLGSGLYFVVIHENERMKIARKIQVIKQ